MQTPARDGSPRRRAHRTDRANPVAKPAAHRVTARAPRAAGRRMANVHPKVSVRAKVCIPTAPPAPRAVARVMLKLRAKPPLSATASSPGRPTVRVMVDLALKATVPVRIVLPATLRSPTATALRIPKASLG